jgi:hypothetical protein
MTAGKVARVFRGYADTLIAQGAVPERMNHSNHLPCSAIEGEAKDNHILWLCLEGVELSATNLEKAFRWLGFVQGYFWATSRYSIYELKEHSRPA